MFWDGAFNSLAMVLITLSSIEVIVSGSIECVDSLKQTNTCWFKDHITAEYLLNAISKNTQNAQEIGKTNSSYFQMKI